MLPRRVEYRTGVRNHTTDLPAKFEQSTFTRIPLETREACLCTCYLRVLKGCSNSLLEWVLWVKNIGLPFRIENSSDHGSAIEYSSNTVPYPLFSEKNRHVSAFRFVPPMPLLKARLLTYRLPRSVPGRVSSGPVDLKDTSPG